MRIRLDREWAEPLVWQETLELSEELIDSSSLAGLSPVCCDGSIEYVSPGFLLKAVLSYQQTLAYIRCLKPVRDQATHDFEALLIIGPDSDPQIAEGFETAEGLEIAAGFEIAEAASSVIRLASEEFDTSTVVVEQVQLQIPMKPLCEEGCLGICPRCGSDRNQKPNCCAEKEYDSRWSGLQLLRDRLQKPDR